MENEIRDLIVIGGGPAGVEASLVAGLIGKRVALIERSPVIGGALTNTGTLPSKTLRETALTLSGVRARRLEVDLNLRGEASVADFMRHERTVSSTERDRLMGIMKDLGVEVVTGTGRFLDPHTLAVVPAESDEGTPRLLSGKTIVIATGSSPVHPAVFPFEHPRIYDSDEILSLEGMPRSLAVIGAGVIGSEYACTFAALGVKVQVIDGRRVLLPFLDAEISRALADAMMANGIRFLWDRRVTGCHAPVTGDIRLTLNSGESLEVDSVLVAAGRSSNSETLNLQAAGITPAERGLLKVDSRFRTEVPHIYAVGDVIGFPALASTSMEQARIAVVDAFSLSVKKEIASLLPTGIFTIPEVSSVGATEEDLQKRGEDYVVGKALYRNNARGTIIGDRQGFLKLLFRRSDMKLLGVHVIGEIATEIVHIGMITILCGGGATELNEACFNIPTLGDLYKIATYRAQITRDRPELLSGR